MTKMLLPSLELTILIINFLSTNLKTVLKKLPIGNFKKHLMIKNTPYYRTTKEIKKFVKNFETKIIPKSPKLTGLFLCSNCVYHKAAYIIPFSSFSFKLTNGKTIT